MIHGWPDKRTLYACCLVLKTFVPVARTQLYRSLTFSTCTTRRNITSLTERKFRHLLDYETSRLRDTVFYRPGLGVHVEEVRIMFAKEGPQLGDQISAQILDDLRSRRPHLKEVCLGLSSEGSDYTNQALGRYGSQLRVLEYDEEHDWTTE